MTAEEVARFERAVRAGGVGLFPADTVYGLAVDPEAQAAVERLYAVKGRPAERPAAVMFFALDSALAALPELGERTRGALARLLPGAVTVVLANPLRRFPLACGPRPDRIGLRVPALEGALAPLGALGMPLLQSSANVSGGPDARRLEQVEPSIRAAVDAELDAGELPGLASTVVDLSGFEEGGGFTVLRDGALSRPALEELSRRWRGRILATEQVPGSCDAELVRSRSSGGGNPGSASSHSAVRGEETAYRQGRQVPRGRSTIVRASAWSGGGTVCYEADGRGKS